LTPRRLCRVDRAAPHLKGSRARARNGRPPRFHTGRTQPAPRPARPPLRRSPPTRQRGAPRPAPHQSRLPPRASLACCLASSTRARPVAERRRRRRSNWPAAAGALAS